MNKKPGLPVFLIALDGLGSILLVLGILGLLEVDIGLPALTTIWPLALILGAGLMVPMIFWVIRKALAEKQNQWEPACGRTLIRSLISRHACCNRLQAGYYKRFSLCHSSILAFARFSV